MYVGLLIEAVIFLIPFLTVTIKLGKTLEKVEEMEKKVNGLSNIDSRLTAIETKIDLLLGGKVKTNG